jgi:hypothetical protein
MGDRVSKLLKTFTGVFVILVWAILLGRSVNKLFPQNEFMELVGAFAGGSFGAFLAWATEYVTGELKQKRNQNQ